MIKIFMSFHNYGYEYSSRLSLSIICVELTEIFSNLFSYIFTYYRTFRIQFKKNRESHV